MSRGGGGGLGGIGPVLEVSVRVGGVQQRYNQGTLDPIEFHPICGISP